MNGDNMPDGYQPHDPEGDEWTCERCGAVVAAAEFTQLHTLFHDAIDTVHPTIGALVEQSTTQSEALRLLLGSKR